MSAVRPRASPTSTTVPRSATRRVASTITAGSPVTSTTRPGAFGAPRSTVTDEHAHQVRDQAAPHDLDRSQGQARDRRRRVPSDGQQSECSRRIRVEGARRLRGRALAPSEGAIRGYGERRNRPGRGRQPVAIDVRERAGRQGADEDRAVVRDFRSNQATASSRRAAGLIPSPESLDRYAASMNACTTSPSSAVTSGVSPRSRAVASLLK